MVNETISDVDAALAEAVDALTYSTVEVDPTGGDVEQLASRLAAVNDIMRYGRELADMVATRLGDLVDADTETAVGRLVRRPVESDRFVAGMSTKHMAADIRDAVAASAATDPTTGEVAAGLKLKVAQAIDTFTSALPPSTKPSASGLRSIGVAYDRFRKVERTGYRVSLERKDDDR